MRQVSNQGGIGKLFRHLVISPVFPLARVHIRARDDMGAEEFKVVIRGYTHCSYPVLERAVFKSDRFEDSIPYNVVLEMHPVRFLPEN